jgi:hypothetical protein
MQGLLHGGSKNYGILDALQNAFFLLVGVKISCLDLGSSSKER